MTFFYLIALVALWIGVGLTWNYFHPDEEDEDQECPYE